MKQYFNKYCEDSIKTTARMGYGFIIVGQHQAKNNPPIWATPLQLMTLGEQRKKK